VRAGPGFERANYMIQDALKRALIIFDDELLKCLIQFSKRKEGGLCRAAKKPALNDLYINFCFGFILLFADTVRHDFR